MARMFGCESAAIARASRWKRSRRSSSLVKRSARTFTATSRPSRASRFLGRRLDEVGLDPDAVARFREVLATVLQSGRRAFHVFDYPTRDGVRAFEARLVPEHDPEGGVASVLVIVRDLTSLRRAQAARAD